MRLIRRRSSILPRANSDPLEFNDDSVERGRARHEPVPSPSTSSTGSRRSLNLGSVAQFTAPQIAAGIAECIKLNTENKINKKNAFKLNMIDFMTYIVRNEDADMSNLQVASTTLDVSAKIYGLRVDVLHQDTMDMVGNLEHEKQNSRDDGNDNADDNTGEPGQSNPHTKTKARKKKRVQLLTTVESLCCDSECVKLEPPMLGDGDYQTSDTLLQSTAPFHVGVGTNMHPYNDYMLDNRIPEVELPMESSAFNPIGVRDRDVGSIFKTFEFVNWDSEYVHGNTVENWTQNNSVVGELYDLNASVLDDNDDGFHNDEFTQNMDMEYNEETAPAALARPRQQEFIVDGVDDDIMSHATTANDYSFFDDKTVMDIRWRAGTQWTVKNPPKLSMGAGGARRREPVRRKKDLVVDLKADQDEEFEAKFAEMKRVKRKFLSYENKISMPPQNGAEPVELFRLGLRPDDDLFMPKRRVQQRNADAERLPPTAEDFQNFDAGGDYDDHVGDDGIDDSLNDMQNDAPSQAMDHDMFASQGGFTGSNLVEAPKLTEKIYIPFSQRAKKLDMRHLKKCIWNSILTTDDKENVGGEDNNSGDKEKNEEPKSFGDIYLDLPDKLNKNDAKELSFPIAFVSLLHLANEKQLTLLSNDDYSDILIRQKIEI